MIIESNNIPIFKLDYSYQRPLRDGGQSFGGSDWVLIKKLEQFPDVKIENFVKDVIFSGKPQITDGFKGGGGDTCISKSVFLNSGKL